MLDVELSESVFCYEAVLISYKYSRAKPISLFQSTVYESKVKLLK